MWKLAFIYHIFLWPLAMSVLMVAAILTPACQSQLGVWLALSAVLGFLVSTPASVYAAKISVKSMT